MSGRRMGVVFDWKRICRFWRLGGWIGEPEVGAKARDLVVGGEGEETVLVEELFGAVGG